VQAVRRLEADHRAVERLFERIQASPPGPARAAAFAEVASALARHAELEERVFYAAIRTIDDVAAQELVSLALDEHDDVHALLAEIEAIDPASDAFAVRCEMLAAEVARHVAMEEEDLFPRAQRLLGSDDLEALGERLDAAPAREAPPVPVRLRKLA